MGSDDFLIRVMSRAELDTAIGWAADEGWNPGVHDAEAYHAGDPDGYFVGLLNGEPVGTISAVKYDAEFAFMGFFIVRQDLRGGWLGPRLAERAFRYVGGAIAGLDGVLEQADHYASIWGFEVAYHNMRYRGAAERKEPVDTNIVPYRVTDLEDVARYDSFCFPAPRRPFLERWLLQPEARALVYREEDLVKGYGMIRRARNGYRIGPLFADDADKAEALFDALVSQIAEGEAVFMDIPLPNGAAYELVARRGMTPEFETARMYRGGSPRSLSTRSLASLRLNWARVSARSGCALNRLGRP